MSNIIGLGIDLGGTKMAGALFDSNGMASPAEVHYLEGRSGQQVGGQILKLIRHFLDLADEQHLKISSVGLAVPGIYYSRSGKVWAPNIPGWEDYPLYSELKDHLDETKISIRIDSDRACYILGEVWKGSAKGCRNAIFLAVGTGIGAGILVDGQVLRGANDIAGAVGWLGLTDSYLPAYKHCGCLEYHASGPGMARMAGEVLSEERTAFENGEPKNREQWTTKQVFDAYSTSDPIAEKVLQRSIAFWGKASANLVSIFNPEKIIFGGGVFGPGVQFLGEIYEEAKKWAQPISISQVEFLPSDFGNEAGLYGAGFLALNPIL